MGKIGRQLKGFVCINICILTGVRSAIYLWPKMLLEMSVVHFFTFTVEITRN